MEGLQRAFRVGEILPWKRIRFVVAEVYPGVIILKPVDTTSGFKKEKARRVR